MNSRAFYLEQTPDSHKVKSYIGSREYKAFQKLAKYLGKSPPAFSQKGFDARLAPSVVIRSELQLLNIDTPRFAVRIYLDEKHDSFVNMRRMIDIKRRLKSANWLPWTTPFVIEDEDNQKEKYDPVQNWMKPSWTFKKNNIPENAIADCVLTPSKEAGLKYSFVRAELGWVCGEAKSIRGVPYVRPLSGFSGAACAQSCAFMVAALLHDYPASPTAEEYGEPGIHGLAEITAITTGSTRRMLRLRGLTPRILMDYFTRTGRRSVQFSFDDANPDFNTTRAMQVISTYVRSGFPTILAVASQQNGQTPTRHNHCIVAVGASNRGAAKNEIIINDPSELPFMKWDRNDLKEKSTIQVRQSDGKFRSICRPQIFSILPHPVRVPLVDASVTLDGVPAAATGLESMAKALWRCMGLLEVTDHKSPELSDFLLFRVALDPRLSTPPRVRLPKEIETLLKTVDHRFQKCWESNLELFAGRWCWLQVCRRAGKEIDFMILWDAERVPIPIDEAKDDPSGKMFGAPADFIFGSFTLNASGWEFKRHSFSAPIPKRPEDRYTQRSDLPPTVELQTAVSLGITPPPAPLPAANRVKRIIKRWVNLSFRNRKSSGKKAAASGDIETLPLQPCLISSFATAGLFTASEFWPSCIRHAEIYAFMHRDEKLLNGIGLPWSKNSSRTIVEIFADVPKHGARRQEIIKLLCQRLVKFSETANVSIDAFATYLPQLFASNIVAAEAAMHAMRVLLDVRRELEKQRISDVRTIEIVAGSLISGLFPARKRTRPDDPPTLFAARRFAEEGYRTLIDRLEQVCASLEQTPHKTDFSLSLELEPGPLFVLNRNRSLLDLATALQESKLLRSRVGFNVDIAHFVLAGIEPEFVFESELLANRICHFHISDHGIGHFGDARLGDCSFGRWLCQPRDNLKVLERWLGFAMRYAAKQQSRTTISPRFSGLVSVEFEAAESPEQVRQSCEVLIDLLRRVGDSESPSPSGKSVASAA